VARYSLGWADLALDQYLALPSDVQPLVDARISGLLEVPDGPSTSYDPGTDHWTTTAAAGDVLMVHVFRVGLPRLVILRVVHI
jgi:hypothetical protein